MDNNTTFTPDEIYLISKIFQNYYCMSISEIADEDERVKSIFQKINLLEEE